MILTSSTDDLTHFYDPPAGKPVCQIADPATVDPTTVDLIPNDAHWVNCPRCTAWAKTTGQYPTPSTIHEPRRA